VQTTVARQCGVVLLVIVAPHRGLDLVDAIRISVGQWERTKSAVSTGAESGLVVLATTKVGSNASCAEKRIALRNAHAFASVDVVIRLALATKEYAVF